MDHNLVIIVLDSLRWDVAREYETRSSLGVIHESESTGCYTLPSHSALFSGSLPLPKSGQFSIGGRRMPRIFRNSGARPEGPEPWIKVRGPSLLNSFSASHRVEGFGGVTYFDPSSPGFSFAPYFPAFTYEGYAASSSAAERYSDMRPNWFPLMTAIEAIRTMASENAEKPFFVFVNEPATHFPFVCREHILTEEDTEALHAFDELSTSKMVESSGEKRKVLKSWAYGRQVTSLGKCLRALEELTSILEISARPTLLITMSDHGEAMGEFGRFGHGFNEPSVNTVPVWVRFIAS